MEEILLKVMKEKNKIVINEEVALGLFDKKEDSIGKGISFNGDIL